MNPHLLNWVALALVGAMATASGGCVSKSNARLRTSSAYFAGRAQGLQNGQANRIAIITLSGPVRNRTIPWTEGLTLAEAIVAAEYLAASNPKSIYVTRNGERIFVDPRRLLRGNDFLLEAGDVVEISN